MRALLREWLSDAGYGVREVGLGGVQREGAADLVIASVYRPKQEGAQLLRAVQAAHPGTPLIAISAVSFRSLGRRSDCANTRCPAASCQAADPRRSARCGARYYWATELRA